MADISGIYKITNPIGEIYIGQSKYIYRRKKEYINMKCFSQPKIYNSILKYGFNNHKFEIIKKCSWEKLNRYEFYYQSKYKSVENGLNCVYTKIQPKVKLINFKEFFKINKYNINDSILYGIMLGILFDCFFILIYELYKLWQI